MNGKTIKTAVIFAVMLGCLAETAGAYDGWADEYIEFCQKRGIISGDENGNIMPDDNLTREQMVKMILTAVSVNISDAKNIHFSDVPEDRWSYQYISKYMEYAIEETNIFAPDEFVKREEFLAMSMKLAGCNGIFTEDNAKKEFSDWENIDDRYKSFIVDGYENGCILGSDGMLNPKDELTRAEACTLLSKIVTAIENKQIITTATPILGEAEASLEQAKRWAKNRDAHERFIEIAELYWKYGEITGIRADVLYAQAAKETAFGKYTGQVKPEQNNWAGIKKYGAVGDEPEDHEDFETPEDGVRGHFNHMGAYVGTEPVGEPHGRYKSVKSLAWAGTVKTVEQLGGKWCPNKGYGNSIVLDFLTPMINTTVN